MGIGTYGTIMGRGSACRAAAGFTLVELLVVVAIIALLLALLLPAMNRARDSAAMMASRANTRSLAFIQTQYANDYKGQMTLGYNGGAAGGAKQFNYIIGHNHTPRGAFGNLYSHGLITNPKALFSPLQTSDQFKFNTHGNPWFDTASHASANPTYSGWMRTGYASRPYTRWSGNNIITQLARRSQLSGRTAIYADITSTPYYAQLVRHYPTINVAFLDGSASGHDASTFNDLWQDLHPTNYAQSLNSIMLHEPGDTPSGIWSEMDG